VILAASSGPTTWWQWVLWWTLDPLWWPLEWVALKVLYHFVWQPLCVVARFVSEALSEQPVPPSPHELMLQEELGRAAAVNREIEFRAQLAIERMRAHSVTIEQEQRTYYR
jgi:hypothetical protein